MEVLGKSPPLGITEVIDEQHLKGTLPSGNRSVLWQVGTDRGVSFGKMFCLTILDSLLFPFIAFWKFCFGGENPTYSWTLLRAAIGKILDKEQKNLPPNSNVSPEGEKLPEVSAPENIGIPSDVENEGTVSGDTEREVPSPAEPAAPSLKPKTTEENLPPGFFPKERLDELALDSFTQDARTGGFRSALASRNLEILDCGNGNGTASCLFASTLFALGISKEIEPSRDECLQLRKALACSMFAYAKKVVIGAQNLPQKERGLLEQACDYLLISMGINPTDYPEANYPATEDFPKDMESAKGVLPSKLLREFEKSIEVKIAAKDSDFVETFDFLKEKEYNYAVHFLFQVIEVDSNGEEKVRYYIKLQKEDRVNDIREKYLGEPYSYSNEQVEELVREAKQAFSDVQSGNIPVSERNKYNILSDFYWNRMENRKEEIEVANTLFEGAKEMQDDNLNKTFAYVNALASLFGIDPPLEDTRFYELSTGMTGKYGEKAFEFKLESKKNSALSIMLHYASFTTGALGGAGDTYDCFFLARYLQKDILLFDYVTNGLHRFPASDDPSHRFGESGFVTLNYVSGHYQAVIDSRKKATP
jgi:hypothetical protein